MFEFDFTVSDEPEVACDLCEELVSADHTVMRDGDERICWMCYADVIASVDDAEVDWGDDDWDDDWDDDDIDWDD